MLPPVDGDGPLHVKSVTPPCEIVSDVVPVNWRLASRVDQFPFGHPASCGVAVGGVAGALMLKLRLPFLISLPGTVVVADAVNGTLFAPGASLPPGFTHVNEASAGALSENVTSPLPRPVSDPVQVSVKVVAVQTGVPPLLK